MVLGSGHPVPKRSSGPRDLQLALRPRPGVGTPTQGASGTAAVPTTPSAGGGNALAAFCGQKRRVKSAQTCDPVGGSPGETNLVQAGGVPVKQRHLKLHPTAPTAPPAQSRSPGAAGRCLASDRRDGLANAERKKSRDLRL